MKYQLNKRRRNFELYVLPLLLGLLALAGILAYLHEFEHLILGEL